MRISGCGRASAMLAALLLVSIGCTRARQYPVGDRSAVAAVVHVAARTGFPVKRATEAGPPETLCHATAIRGVLNSASGDTLHFRSVREVVVASSPGGDRRDCPERVAVFVVRTDATDVTVRVADERRTLALIVLLAGALVALAYAIGNIPV